MDIRLAEPADAAAIARLHVIAWQAAYRGQLPDQFLENLSVPERENMWRSFLANSLPESRVFVAEEDEVVGFACTGRTRDTEAPPNTGEIVAIYLHPSLIGSGRGRILFEYIVDNLRMRGYEMATLWVLETNERARRFYEQAGWHHDGATRIEEQGTAKLREVRYACALTKSQAGVRQKRSDM
jgi:GNAT superfamily N-acetyltransferase